MISVLLPTYNEPIEFVEESIRSILRQTYNDIELLLIIDNPNRDDILSFAKKTQKNDTRINIIRNRENIGLTASLNKAINIARGDYIARMDADDVSVDDRFEKQLRYLKDNNLDLVGGAITDLTPEGEVIKNNTTYYPGNNQYAKKLLKYDTAAAHPTWLGKAEIFKEYKYNDYPACEDYDFLTRISIDNKRIGSIPETLLYYRQNRNSITKTKKALQRSSLYYIRKNYRKNKKANLDAFNAYMQCASGKVLLRETEDFCDVLDTLKYKKEIKTLNYFKLVDSKVKRSYLIGIIYGRLIRKRRRFKSS